jgi:DNA-binding CsgD family transcriptional regulator
MEGSQDEILRIVAEIYQTVQNPGRWRSILEDIASLVGFELVAISFSPAHRYQFGAFDFIGREDAMAAYHAHFGEVSPFGEPILAMPDGRRAEPGAFVVPRDELVRTEYFNDWMRDAGLNDSMTALDKSRERGMTALSGFTGKGELVDEEQVATMRLLMPHVFNALDLRRQFERLERKVEVSRAGLERADFGCVFIDDRGQVKWMNPLAHDIVELGAALEQVAGELRARVPHARREFTEAIRAALDVSMAEYGSPAPIFTLPRTDDRPPIEVLVSPVQQETLVLGEVRGALVLLADPTHVNATFAERLSVLHDLTPAEAEVAQWLVSGSSPNEIAEISDRSPHTIRTHLKRIFAKTNTSSQGELVGLLQRGLSRLR